MNLRGKIKDELNKVYGEFNTYLECEYEKTFIEKLEKESLDKHLTESEIEIRRAWLTYNQVLVELKHNIKDNLKVKELQYRLTDDENPNNACIEVIQNISSRTEELDRLPVMHKARKNPNLMIERKIVDIIDLPPLSKIDNKVDVIVFGKDPIER